MGYTSSVTPPSSLIGATSSSSVTSGDLPRTVPTSATGAYSTAAPCGVGPELTSTSDFSAPSPSPFDLSQSVFSISPLDFHAQHFTRSSRGSEAPCPEVYIWFWPLDSRWHHSEPPPPPELASLTENVPLMLRHPQSDAVGCRLCWQKFKIWKTYKNCGTGLATTLKAHLTKHHHNEYEDYIRTREFERMRSDDKRHAERARESFTVGGLLERLLRFAVVDDQVRQLWIRLFPRYSFRVHPI